MAPPEVEADEQDEESQFPEGADIFYVSQKLLEECKAKVKAGEDVDASVTSKMADASELPDDEVMVPIDMRGAGDDLDDDVGSMVEKLGPKRSAEMFVKCADFFAANKENEPEDERPQNITAAEWKTLGESDCEGEEEDDFSFEDEEEEEGADDGSQNDEEPEPEAPKAKKAKTS
mmetsp:Transcript_58801/g.164176  ORF Transcript_58801/g.164176 Transcript_58801/m.164176 type:complete len:175 (+) Transcript_58801:75-599(+)